ncbi:MAG: peroxiredoxin [Myxococcales bacterium]|nr:peroxiredoxin [Myxococcales bacterium]
MSIQIGDRIPSATLHEGSPKDHVDPAEAFGSGRVLIFGVPGAFTPGCDKTHLPGYVGDHDKFKAKGIDQIVCVAVNDAFVMQSWGASQNAGEKVRMLADPAAELTKKMGLEVDATAALGGVRSKRYAMVLQDGVVTHLEVEPDGFGLSCSLAGSILERI